MKEKGRWALVFGERGVGRRMKIRALNELMWKARRKWASSV